MAPEQAASVQNAPHWLDIVERIGKLASIVAIPIVIPLALASYSAKVQENSQKETINRDYVQLAVSILTQKKDDSTTALRDWAVDLLSEHSPTKFKPEVISALKTGTISLPEPTPSNPLTAFSPDGNKIARATGRHVEISYARDPRNGSAIGLNAPVSTLAFSQDGILLAIGSSDDTVSIFNTDTRAMLLTQTMTASILNVRFSAPTQLAILTADMTFVLDVTSGRILQEIHRPSGLSGIAH